MAETKEILKDAKPDQAIDSIAQILRQDKAHNINCLIVEIASQSAIENEIVSDLPATIYIDQPAEKPKSRLIFDHQKEESPKTNQKPDQTYSTKQDQLTNHSSKNYFRSAMVAVGSKTMNLFARHKPGKTARPTENTDHYRGDVSQWHQNLNSAHNQIPPIPNQKHKVTDSIWHYTKLIFVSIYKALVFLVTSIGRLFRSGSQRTLYAVIIVIAIIGLVFGVYEFRQGRKNSTQTAQAQTIYNQAVTKEKSAENIAPSNPASAHTLYIDAKNLANSVKNNKKVAPNATTLIALINKNLDSLDNIVRYTNLNPLATVMGINDKSIRDDLTLINGQLYITGKDDGKIVSFDFSQKRSAIAYSIPSAQGEVRSSTLDGSDIVYLTSKNQLYRFKIADKDASEITLTSGKIENASALFSFFNKFYLLDATEGQIYRHNTIGTDSVGAGTAYLSQPSADLQGGKDLSIDGYIYVLKSNGSIIRYASAAPDPAFQLKNLPAPRTTLAKATKIKADETLNFLYALDQPNGSDPARIVQFAKDGKYYKQYILPASINYVSDFVVDQKLQKIDFLANNKVYQIDL